MSKKILITGGAGFIGSHLADELLKQGYRVRILDNLCAQVHGQDGKQPEYLDPDIELIKGDVRDATCLRQSLQGIDAVYHFAAMLGIGQSMYEVTKYIECNSLGTATLLQTLIEMPVERLIVASSMSVYGEGLYLAPDGSIDLGVERSVEQLKAGCWDVRNSHGEVLIPTATPETKPPASNSIYALSKFDQECMCLMIGNAYGIPTVALRFFNVFGTRQAISNPYTGVVAIFISRLLNGEPPLIFEDGRQKRDFVSVHDAVQACCQALEMPTAAGHVFNIASGRAYTILEIAEKMTRVLNKDLKPKVIGKYRTGDIRHCYADISKAHRMLGFEPRVSLEDGIKELGDWLHGQKAVDRVADAHIELIQRGLVI